jgi:hypothetical protein
MILHDYPPNYAEIEQKFDLRNYKPIFAFAPHIYVPHRNILGPELIEHEHVHIRRQGVAPEKWWHAYLVNENFRLAEEILAHVVEYQVLAAGRPRNERRRIFDIIAGRLCAPMYGYNPPLHPSRAHKLLKEAMHTRQKTSRAAVVFEPVNANARPTDPP